MNLLNQLNSVLSGFDSVALEDTTDVKLMDRIDRKYWFHSTKLIQLLEKALQCYNILEINGQRLMDYETIYFDTPENTMYLKN